VKSNNSGTIYLHRDTTLGQIWEFQLKKLGHDFYKSEHDLRSVWMSFYILLCNRDTIFQLPKKDLKAKHVSTQRVWNFVEENIFLELKKWWLDRRPSRPINVINPTFVSIVYALAMNN